MKFRRIAGAAGGGARRRERAQRVAACLSGLLLIWLPAWAQQAEPETEPELIELPARPAPPARPGLEEIVVTAEARERSLQDVPNSVTAFSAGQIESAGIRSSGDFVELVPNMSLDDSFTYGNSFVQVRGVTQINNADAPVAVVVDGVPQNNQKQFKQDLFDIERIEVLKGPQGALYGRNAIGGAVNIITRMPSQVWEGRLNAGVGNGGLRRASVALGGPLLRDRLLLRLAGSAKRFDGITPSRFHRRPVDFYEALNLRGRLLWQALESLDIDLRLAHARADGGCCSDTFLPDDDGGDNPQDNSYQPPFSNVLGRTLGPDSDESSLKLDWYGGAGRLSLITAWTQLDEAYFGDLDFRDEPVTQPSVLFGSGSGQQQDLRVRFLSQEIRFLSPDELPLRWLAGLYAVRTDRALTTIVSRDVPGTEPVTSPDSLEPVLTIFEDNDNLAWAGFARLEFDLGAAYELSLGLRYDSDERRHRGGVEPHERGSSDPLADEALPFFGTPPPEPVRTRRQERFDDLQARVVLTRRWRRDLLGYLSYSEGFRSGGFNSAITMSRRFAPETLENYELGFKSQWLGRRLRLNGALFHARSHDFQFFFVEASTGSQIIDNIQEVELQGLDLELDALISPAWSVYFSFGFTDSRILESRNRPQDVGKHTPKNQRYSANLGTRYERPLFGPWELRLRLDGEGRGRKYWHSDNRHSMDPLSLVNARVAVAARRLSVSLWGRNLLDRRYWQDYNAAEFSGLPGGDLGFLARGRSYGIELDYRWD